VRVFWMDQDSSGEWSGMQSEDVPLAALELVD
jgi:hypothetical protein